MTSIRSALVTGASRGIGKAVAEVFAGQGIRVIGTATASPGLSAIEETLAGFDTEGLAVQLDVTDPASIDALAGELQERDIAPEIVVNNAGITRDNLLLRMKEEEWDAVIEADLKSVFSLCKRFLRGMVKARHGRIINVTSVVGVAGNAGQTNYAAAKAGIIGFTKSLAREVANRGITVNAVAPGFIDTDMTRDLGETQHQNMLGQIPVRRLGTPAEVAAAVGFLASDSASYITGETIHVNGGMYMT